LRPERRIREHHLEALVRIRFERVVDDDGALVLLVADPVQEEVHHAEPGGVVDDLPPAKRVVPQVPFLVGVEQVVPRDPLVRREQEPARSARRVADPHSRLRAHHPDDRLDQRARREVLAGPRLHVLGVLLE
jgi:hypothetical protein